jgi:thiamine kinase-like enzyme
MFELARSAVHQVSALPTTLIHGEFYASNVLVDSSAEAPRIRPIDWETTGIGCGLLDLAALASGSWSAAKRHALADAYITELGQESTLAGAPDPTAALRQCRLLLAMKWIGWSSCWKPPPQQRHDWVGEALAMADCLNDRTKIACRSDRTKT